MPLKAKTLKNYKPDKIRSEAIMRQCPQLHFLLSLSNILINKSYLTRNSAPKRPQTNIGRMTIREGANMNPTKSEFLEWGFGH